MQLTSRECTTSEKRCEFKTLLPELKNVPRIYKQIAKTLPGTRWWVLVDDNSKTILMAYL